MKTSKLKPPLPKYAIHEKLATIRSNRDGEGIFYKCKVESIVIAPIQGSSPERIGIKYELRASFAMNYITGEVLNAHSYATFWCLEANAISWQEGTEQAMKKLEANFKRSAKVLKDNKRDDEN